MKYTIICKPSMSLISSLEVFKHQQYIIHSYIMHISKIILSTVMSTVVHTSGTNHRSLSQRIRHGELSRIFG